MFYYVVQTPRYGSGKIKDELRANLIFEIACDANEGEVTLHQIDPTDPDNFTLLRRRD